MRGERQEKVNKRWQVVLAECELHIERISHALAMTGTAGTHGLESKDENYRHTETFLGKMEPSTIIRAEQDKSVKKVRKIAIDRNTALTSVS